MCETLSTRWRNTEERIYKNGTKEVRLHSTAILAFFPDGMIRVNTGGYPTVATKRRMNQYLNDWQVFQKNFEWFVINHNTQRVFAFVNGMFLDGDRVYCPILASSQVTA